MQHWARESAARWTRRLPRLPDRSNAGSLARVINVDLILPKRFRLLSKGGVLGAALAALGLAFPLTLMLPAKVTAFAGVQALWCLAAAMRLILRRGQQSRNGLVLVLAAVRRTCTILECLGSFVSHCQKGGRI